MAMLRTLLCVLVIDDVIIAAPSLKDFIWPGTTLYPLDGDDVTVETQLGSVLGKRREGLPEAGGSIESVEWYLGIPYAVPPVGNLRFKAPVSAQGWQGVRNATMFGPVCPQRDPWFQLPSGEDCLTLNIFSPYQDAASSDALYPVMVYIHGGSYRVGTGASYLGHLLAQRGVVVVTINFRLGILGFLSARSELLPGNNGILDQIESLRWIQDNIRAFKGDPDQVTIFGNSAGGASVGILSVSPLARGLFRKAIVQSGSPLSFWALHNDTVDLHKYVRDFSKVFRCNYSDMEDLVSCLRKVDAMDLSDSTLDDLPSISASNTNFRPHVDGYVIPDDLRELFASAHINADVIMAGVVEREWSKHIGMMIPELMQDHLNFDSALHDGMNRASFLRAIDHIFCYKFGWGDFVAGTVAHEYTNWSHVEDPIANREMYIKFMTDFGMVAPTVELTNLIQKRGLPVYFYQFNHKSNADAHQWRSNAHLIELQYIFGAPYLGYEMVYGFRKNYTAEDKDMSRYMMDRWSDFAKFGEPSASRSASEAQWKPYESETTDYMAISVEDTDMKDHLKVAGVHFWNQVILPAYHNQQFHQTCSQTTPLASQLPVTDATVAVWVLGAVCVMMGLAILGLGVVVYKERVITPRENRPVGV